MCGYLTEMVFVTYPCYLVLHFTYLTYQLSSSMHGARIYAITAQLFQETSRNPLAITAEILNIYSLLWYIICLFLFVFFYSILFSFAFFILYFNVRYYVPLKVFSKLLYSLSIIFIHFLRLLFDCCPLTFYSISWRQSSL